MAPGGKGPDIRRIFTLSTQLAKATFKLRNENSYLGFIWYLLNPILMFLLLFFIFKDRLGDDIQSYPLYLFLGIIMFNYFQAITQESTHSIRTNGNVVKTLKFPLISLNISVIMVTFLAHVFEVGVLVIFLLFYNVPAWGIILYPVVLIFFSIFCLGCSLILSALAVYFTDLYHIWAFASRLLFFATPIFYSLDSGTLLFKLNLLNPMYYYITITREIIVYNSVPDLWLLLGTFGFTLIVLAAGLVIFNVLKNKFAELI